DPISGGPSRAPAEAVHLEQPAPQAFLVGARERARPSPRGRIVVIGLPARFRIDAGLRERLAPDVRPDTIENEIQRLVPVDAVEPLGELPQMPVTELVHERRLLDRERIARTKTHRMARAAGVARRIVDDRREPGLRERQTRAGLEGRD